MKKLITLALVTISFITTTFAQDKLIPVRRDYKYGYAYEENGPLILGAKYDDAGYFEEGLAPVKIGDKWGYINEQGVNVIPMKYGYAGLFSNGYATVGQGSDGQYKYGLIDKKGTLIIPCKYDGLGDYEEGLISVLQGTKMGFMNLKGVMVIPLKFDFTSGQMADFANGYARVQVGTNHYEYIDKTGKVITKRIYAAGADFKEGMAVVAVDTNWDKKNSDWSKVTMAYGCINTSGQEVIKCQYINISAFDGGYAMAYDPGYQFKIDKTGKIIDTVVKPAPRKVIQYDSTTFSGKYNGKPMLNINNSGFVIKSVTVNGMAVADVYHDIVTIQLAKYKLRKGAALDVKVVYKKGSTVRLSPNGGLDQ